MRTKQELYSTARRLVAGRRQRAITLAEEARQRARGAIPALAQAEAAVRARGFEAARLAACGAPAAQRAAALEAGKAAERERDDLLRAHGFSPEALEPKFTCPLCKDTGTRDGRMCACVAQLARGLRREEIAQASALSLSSFDSMDMALYPELFDPQLGMTQRQYMAQVLAQLREYADTFDEKSVSLVLRGNAGLGKTHAALAIAGTVLEKGYDVVYLSAQELFGQLEKSRFETGGLLLEGVLGADLFILDDLGTEYVSPYMLSCFYTILNTRICTGRPTIYTTNIVDGTAFEARYTEKIASRLGGDCEEFLFVGEDIRQLLR